MFFTYIVIVLKDHRHQQNCLSNMVHIIIVPIYDWKITAYFINYMHI